MRCYCCEADVDVVRKVKLRRIRQPPDPAGGPNSPAWQFHRRETTYRWAVICLGCYRILDNHMGLAEIGGKAFNIAGQSRGDKAAVLDEMKYRLWQKKESRKLGLD
jgi:hypothetical protein